MLECLQVRTSGVSGRVFLRHVLGELVFQVLPVLGSCSACAWVVGCLCDLNAILDVWASCRVGAGRLGPGLWGGLGDCFPGRAVRTCVWTHHRLQNHGSTVLCGIELYWC